MKLPALTFLLLIGCASNTAPPSVPVPVPLAESLSSANCGSGEFRGSGIGKSDGEALNAARSDLARQINSSLKVSEKYKQSQQVSGGRENLSSEYESELVIEANLLNAHDARILRIERRPSEAGAVVCMSRTDAAKGFIERQRLAADSLELVSVTMLGTEHPRQKNEAWHKTQMLWNEIMRIQSLLEGWGVESFHSADEIYSRAREDYKNYCGSAKLHWNPEKESLYSEIAFANLSRKMKIEKSPCAASGISLAYKSSEPECSVKFGLNTCSYALSLSLCACDGTEYLQLKNDAMGAHQKPDFALEKLQGNLKSAEFWNQWMQEIKQWSPQCE